MTVELIDMAGVMEKGYDLSNVIACDVLGVPCYSNKTLLGTVEQPVVKNVKKGMGNMGSTTEKQLQRIETLIRRRDCSFQHLRDHPKLKILYAYEILNVWDDCEARGDQGLERKKLIEKITKLFEPSADITVSEKVKN